MGKEKTAETGVCAHWKLPKRLGPEALWLAHYVILSRPRNLKDLASYGVPDRSLLEGGPPEAIDGSFSETLRRQN